MPWSANNLPPSVKNKEWSEHQIEVFVKAANAALKQYGDDGKAIAIGINAADSINNAMPEVSAEFKKIAFMNPGVCNYSDLNKGNLLVKKETIDNMLKSIKGKPIIIEHNNNIDPNEVHGYVHNAYYDSKDGQFYAEFSLHTQEGKKAAKLLKNGSCSYKPIYSGKGGLCNAVSYNDEVIGGEFTHLALVKNPRYENAKILNNSKKENLQMSEELEKNIIEKMSEKISELFNSRFPQVLQAKDEHIVIVNGVEMTVKELVNTCEKAEKESKSKEELENEAKAKAEKESKEKEEAEAKSKSEKENQNSMDKLFNDLNNAASKSKVEELTNNNPWLSEQDRVNLGRTLGI